MGQASTVGSVRIQLFPMSRESPFVLMFGRDPITPIAKLLETRPRYYGDKGGMLCMDTLRKLYMVTAENIHRAREKTPKKEGGNKLQVGDLVFVRDPDSGVFEPRYSPNYRVIAIHGANRIEVQDEKGHRSIRRTGHVKRIEPVDKVCQQLPPEEVYRQFGRASKLLLHPSDVPDVKFLEVEKRINREKGNDKITICELTAHPQEDIEDEEMYNKGSEKSINPSGIEDGGTPLREVFGEKSSYIGDKGEYSPYRSNKVNDGEVYSSVASWNGGEGPNRESENSLNRRRELEIYSWESILHRHKDISDKSEKSFYHLEETCDSKLTPRETAPRYHDDSIDKNAQTITRLQSVKGIRTHLQEKKESDQRTFACSNQSDYSDYSLDHPRDADEYKTLVCVEKRRYRQWTREVQDNDAKKG